MPLAVRLAVMPRAIVILIALMLVTAFTAAAIAVGSSFVPSTPLPPTGLARNGLIAWDNNGDLWAADGDGSGLRLFVSDPELDINPIWSPDGAHLAFWAVAVPESSSRQFTAVQVNTLIQSSTADLIVVDAFGSDRRALVSHVKLDTGGLPASWSPDSRRLTYSYLDGAAAWIGIVSLDGAAPTSVIAGHDPTWSPDGTLLAYRGGTLANEVGVWIVGADGSDPHKLTSIAGSGFAFSLPQWSPDGTSVAFYSSNDGTHDIWLAATDGSGETAIATDPADEYWPYWSPDGSRIAFQRVVDPSHNLPELVVIDPDGSRVTIADPRPLMAGAPLNWSPDGTRLIGFVPNATFDRAASVQLVDVGGALPPVVIASSSSWASASWQRLAP